MVFITQGVALNWADPCPNKLPRIGDSTRKTTTTESGLVAIILATKSSRGESIVFHYPPEPTVEMSDPHNESDSDSDVDEYYPPHAAQRPSLESRNTEGHMPTIPERENSQMEDGKEEWTPAWKRIFGLDSSLLADIFTPQQSDPKFEMWIDDLIFLGRPVHLRSDGSWFKSRGESHGVEQNHLDLDVDEDCFQPTPALESSILSVDSTMESSSIPTTSQTDLMDKSPMTSFHLVFAMNSKLDATYRKHVEEIYDNVVNPLSLALTYEQAKSDYVWQQCEKIKELKAKAETTRTNIATTWHDILYQCDLAEIIQETYTAISNGEMAHLFVNKRLNLSLAVPQHLTSDVLPSDPDNQHPFLNSALSFGLSMEEADPLLVPHYALILLDDTESVLASVPWETVPRLEELVRLVKPTITLHAISDMMHISVHEAVSLARCLFRWRCALPIPPLHARNIYATNPLADMSQLGKGSYAFSRRFPDAPPLPHILASLSRTSAPLSTHLTTLGGTGQETAATLDVLAWLVREQWSIQVRTFVWIKIRREIKASTAQREEGSEGGRFEDSIIRDPYNASDEERVWLRALAGRHAPHDGALFLRICKYFNGRHAVEKIIVREGLSAYAVRRILDVFQADLIKSYTW